jgi:radical SAM superfamily enzyme YgiQ (UPF0313 family)
MNKVLLINPKTPKITQVPLPLGLLYIASYLMSKNIKVEFLDLNTENHKRLFERLDEFKPDFVGISSDISNIKNAKEIARKIKEKNQDIKIIFGGPDPSSLPERYSERYIDAVIIGEGEVAIYEYIRGKLKNRVIKSKGYINNLDEIRFFSEETNINHYHLERLSLQLCVLFSWNFRL